MIKRIRVFSVLMLLTLVAAFCSCGHIQGYLEYVEQQQQEQQQGGESTDTEMEDTTVYLSSPQDRIDYQNEKGQRVVLDLTEWGTSLVGKTVTVGGDVNELVIRGLAGKTYSALNFVIESHDTLPLTLVLESFAMVGDSTEGTVVCRGGRTLILKSEGAESRIDGAPQAPAVYAPQSVVRLDGASSMVLTGGLGADGAHATGENGASGSEGSMGAMAVVATQIEKYSSGTVTLVGGNGGRGGDGAKGANGSMGSSGDGDIWVQTTKPVKSAGTGSGGGRGGDGGKGGDGGLPLNIDCRVNVYEGRLCLNVGTGGNGGNGGDGGIGGKGGTGGDADKGGWMFGLGWTYGTNGGTGGDGGMGGNGGNGGASDATVLRYVTNTSDPALLTLGCSHYGNGGMGGNGGNGGTGGIGGSCDDTVASNGCQINGQKCTCGGRGGNGGAGGTGGNGGDGHSAGNGGMGGVGGSAGEHRNSKKSCSCVGKGSAGRMGQNGTIGQTVITTQPENPTPSNPSSENGNWSYPGYGGVFPEGTSSAPQSDGSTVFVLPDGTLVRLLTNGTVLTLYPDGSWKQLNIDGSALSYDAAWTANPYTALVPKPDFEMSPCTPTSGFSVDFLGVSREQITEYAEMLMWVGFAKNIQITDTADTYEYIAYDDQNHMVVLSYDIVYTNTGIIHYSFLFIPY